MIALDPTILVSHRECMVHSKYIIPSSVLAHSKEDLLQEYFKYFMENGIKSYVYFVAKKF